MMPKNRPDEQNTIIRTYSCMRNSIIILTLLTCLTACTTAQRTNPVADTAAAPAPDKILVDFAGDRLGWSIEDDRVMGGVSQGKVAMTDEGHLRFWGDVSLDNNGGFSSVQSSYDNTYEVSDYGSFQLRVKGDGSKYTFRVKRARYERHSYAYTFPTSGEWETITIPFGELTPTFRGYKPNLPAYAGEPINQLRILIGNKKPQSFEILVDKIGLK